MKHAGKRFLRLAVGVGILIVAAGVYPGEAAWAQPRTIKIVVPFPPGGAADTVARLLADRVSRTEGVTATVENRPGAASVIGTEAVLRGPSDGSVLLIAANSFLISAVTKKVTYNPLSDFEPVCNLVRSPHVLAVNSASPYSSLPDFFGAARSKPGHLTLGSVGPGTAQHLAFELLKSRAIVDVTFVPFAGTAPAVNALLGNHLTSVLVNYPEVSAQVKAGTLRALATTLKSRIDLLPDVPTIAESGYPDFETETWNGIVVPSNTPKGAIAQFVAWFTRALQAPEIISKLKDLGLDPAGICSNEFGTYLLRQMEEYRHIIRQANIKSE